MYFAHSNTPSLTRFTTFLQPVLVFALAIGAVSHVFAAAPVNTQSFRTLLGSPERAALSAKTDTSTKKQIQALRAKLQKSGSLRVIVGLRVPFAAEGLMAASSVKQQRSDITVVRKKLVSRVKSSRSKVTAEFKTIPFMGMQIDQAGLNKLLADPSVINIVEEIPSKPSLVDSVPLIGADKAWSEGDAGKGMTVAIVDTGVDKKHPFLSGKVVSEACYSTADIANGLNSLCPGGVKSSIAQGSGVNCPASVDGCEHGTHVAGIAAGSGKVFSGVAKGASIIAIQVFSSLNQKVICDSSGRTTPCAVSWPTDQVGALERVLALRNTYKIASLNMSLGGGKKYISQSECDLAPQNTAMKTAIDNLRSVGIATVIASGNESFRDGLAAPGCISSAVSVGNTTKQNTIAEDSNSANFLSLLAPGTAIESSIPRGFIPGILSAAFNGTSMAAPHVAGAWAILKQAKPTASVSEIMDALTKTGVPIRDPRNGITKPRIQVDAALQQLVGNSGADAPSQISPSDQFTTGPNPPYVWTAVKGATGYLIWVNNIDTTGKLLPGRVDQYMPIDQVWCSKGQCAMKGKVALVPGTADWWITAFFSATNVRRDKMQS